MLEEALQGFTGHLKVQVTGPWTLAATVERPRGDKVLADHGNRRELAAGAGGGGPRPPGRRTSPGARRRPAPAPGGRARPRGGAARRGTHRLGVRPAPLGGPARALRAPGVAVRGGHRVGRGALGPLVRGGYAPRPAARRGCPRAVGRHLRAGRPPTTTCSARPSRPERAWRSASYPRSTRPRSPPAQQLTDQVLGWLDRLGLDPDVVGQRLLVTPACGLAGASPAWARGALALCREVAANLT